MLVYSPAVHSRIFCLKQLSLHWTALRAAGSVLHGVRAPEGRDGRDPRLGGPGIAVEWRACSVARHAAHGAASRAGMAAFGRATAVGLGLDPPGPIL